jgi:hypothetical protein
MLISPDKPKIASRSGSRSRYSPIKPKAEANKIAPKFRLDESIFPLDWRAVDFMIEC